MFGTLCSLNHVPSGHLSTILRPSSLALSLTRTFSELEMDTKKRSWQAIAQEYRAGIAAKIPPSLRLDPAIIYAATLDSSSSVLRVPSSCGLLTPAEIDITENNDAMALLGKIARLELSSYAVTAAFCKRAAIAQQLVSNNQVSNFICTCG